MLTLVPTKSRADSDNQHRPAELDKVLVVYDEDGTRRVTCFCQAAVTRSIVPHFKSAHADLWSRWVQTFLDLRAKGLPLKRIMRLFRAGSGELLFSWTVIERSIRAQVESGNAGYSPPPKSVSHWEPLDFNLEKTTVWDFPRRGDWAVHHGDYRGNWPPQVPRNLILRYTRPNQLVVDAFAGGGTSLVEAWLLGRRSVGIDIGKMAIQTCGARIAELEAADGAGRNRLIPARRPIILQGNALALAELLAGAGIRQKPMLICAHPPYLDSIKYSTSEDDLSATADVSMFLARIAAFGRAVLASMHKEGRLAFLIGDVRKNGRVVHLGIECVSVLRSEGFVLEHLIMKTQHHDRSSEFYYPQGYDELLMGHEYLLILQRS